MSEEAMLEREDFVKSDNTALETVVNEVVAPVKSKEVNDKVPHKIYMENGQRVTYTKQGSRIVFGTSNIGMVVKEFAYFHAYPEEFEKIYGEHLKRQEIEKSKQDSTIKSNVGTRYTSSALESKIDGSSKDIEVKEARKIIVVDEKNKDLEEKVANVKVGTLEIIKEALKLSSKGIYKAGYVAAHIWPISALTIATNARRAFVWEIKDGGYGGETPIPASIASIGSAAITIIASMPFGYAPETAAVLGATNLLSAGYEIYRYSKNKLVEERKQNSALENKVEAIDADKLEGKALAKEAKRYAKLLKENYGDEFYKTISAKVDGNVIKLYSQNLPSHPFILSYSDVEFRSRDYIKGKLNSIVIRDESDNRLSFLKRNKKSISNFPEMEQRYQRLLVKFGQQMEREYNEREQRLKDNLTKMQDYMDSSAASYVRDSLIE